MKKIEKALLTAVAKVGKETAVKTRGAASFSIVISPKSRLC